MKAVNTYRLHTFHRERGWFQILNREHTENHTSLTSHPDRLISCSTFFLLGNSEKQTTGMCVWQQNLEGRLCTHLRLTAYDNNGHKSTYQLEGSFGHFGWTLGCLKLSEGGKKTGKLLAPL